MPNFLKTAGDYANIQFNRVTKAGDDFISSISGGKNVPSTTNDSDLIFPLEMRQSGLANKPVILFSAFVKGEGKPVKIYLPTPAGIQFADQGTYSTIDLGAIGSTAANAIASVAQGEGFSNAAKNVLSSINKENSIAIAGRTLGVGEQTSFLTKSVVNPNTNTTFTSNNLRSFAFNFKMIASSAAESEIIRQIHTRFRYYTYADTKNNEDNILLEYPPVWTIKFFDMSTGQENKYIPRIFSCYLTQCQSTFNSGGNMFYSDNAPLEVDVNLTFQETRTLTRKDIQDMENDQLENRGIDENGNPTIQGAPALQELNSAPETTGSSDV